MADSVPMSVLRERARSIQFLVDEMARCVLDCDRTPGTLNPGPVQTAWANLRSEILAVGPLLPPEEDQLSDWIREVAKVCEWFDEQIRKSGSVANVVFYTNCDEFDRVASAGKRLLASLPKIDPFAFLDNQSAVVPEPESVAAEKVLAQANNGDTPNAEIRQLSPRPPKRETIAPKRSWTQRDLDAEINEYKARRASNYSELLSRVQGGGAGAKRAAQKMFGRNAIVRELGVKSPAMVTNSPVWQKLADELQIPRGKDRNTQKHSKVGLDFAVEVHAADVSQSAFEVAVRNETIDQIRSALPEPAAGDLIDKLDRGETTDDEARAIVELAKDQRRDSHARQVRGNP